MSSISSAAKEYDAFGNIIPNSPSGTWIGRFTYQGQSWLEITSSDASKRLLLSPTRIYDPVTGRFLQSDPLLKNAILGIGATITKPRQHRKSRAGVVPDDLLQSPDIQGALSNLMGYFFVDQNPITKTDAPGLQEEGQLGSNAQQALQNMLENAFNETLDPSTGAKNFGLGLYNYAEERELFQNLPPYQLSGPKAAKSAGTFCSYAPAAHQGLEFLKEFALPPLLELIGVNPGNFGIPGNPTFDLSLSIPISQSKDLGKLWGISLTIRF